MNNKISLGKIVHSGLGHLPNQLDALNAIYLQYDNDDNRYLQSSISHLYVISLCSFLETLLKECYRLTLFRNYPFENEQLEHLVGVLEEKLKHMSWNNLKESDTIYLEEEMPQSIKQSPSYVAINELFKLRNLIVHGNEFEIDIWQNDLEIFYKVGGKAEHIYQYLINQKLFDKKNISDSTHFQLNRECICFFIKETFEFSKELTQYISIRTKVKLYDELTTKGIIDLKYVYKLCPEKKF